MNTEFEFKTLAEFVEHFKDEETCRGHFAAMRFANGEYCPHCGHRKIYAFNNGKRYRCADCKKDFTIVTGTVFGETKLPLKKWYIAIYLLLNSSKGISSMQLAKHVGVTQKTGWFMDHRIREAIKQNGGKLFGTIECDETFVGGAEKNKHKSKRTKGTQGRSMKTKAAILGVVQRGGEVRALAVSDCKVPTIEKHILRNVESGSQIHTDDFYPYARIGRLFIHETVSHRTGEYVRGPVHTNSVESFWALFKRGFHGVYHHMSRKHLQRYVDESVFRWNQKPAQMSTVFRNAVMGVAGSQRLPYKELIA